MATKKILTIDGSLLSKIFKDVLGYIKGTRLKVTNKNDKTIANIPLFLAVIVGIILPVLTITAVIVVLVLSYQITIEKETKSDLIIIDQK